MPTVVRAVLVGGVAAALGTLPWAFLVSLNIKHGSSVPWAVPPPALYLYMQRPIERRHGPVVAILTTGLLFGFAHFTHPEVTLSLLPFYLAVAAVYGSLAALTDSILPGVVLHAGGSVFSAITLFSQGRSEWQASPTAQPLIRETGSDASFWMTVASFLVAAGATVGAYAALAGAVRAARASARAETA